MRDNLRPAYKLAEQVRFSGDKLRRFDNLPTAHTDRVRSFSAQHALRIAPEVTPALSACLEKVYERLRMPPGAVEAYVYSSPEVQAECYSGNYSDCIVRFSSGLIDLLDDEEVEFVIGHEIGHFLLGHGGSNAGPGGESIERYMQQRCQEISVDRIGLLACRSLDIAIRAMMKTISGLTSRHLRFDVATFLSQLRQVDNFGSADSPMATHPSILFRCRALLWFSLSEFFLRGEDYRTDEQMAPLDRRVESDMDRFVDGPARRMIEDAKGNLGIWMAAYKAIEDGVFKRDEQAAISELFGDEMLDKLKNYLAGLSSFEVQSAVFERLMAARQELEVAIPDSFESEYERIKSQIDSRFR